MTKPLVCVPGDALAARTAGGSQPDRRVPMALIAAWLVAYVALAIFAPDLAVHWVIGAVVGGLVGWLISLAVFR